MIKFIAVFSILILSACSGGDSTPCGASGETPNGDGGDTPGGDGGDTPGSDGNPDSFLDTSATQSFVLTTISIEGGATWVGGDTAKGNIITFDGINGTFSNDRYQIYFEGDEGTADIISQGTEYVALFNANPRNAEPFLGVIGTATAVPALPSGSAGYFGTSSAHFAIIDCNTGTTFDVTGDVSAMVDFDDGSVGLTFDSLTDTSVTSAAAPVAATDIGTLEIEDAVMVGGQFHGGTAEFISGASSLTDLSLNASVTTSGGIFGPAGEEIAGVVIVEDGTADLQFIGGFVSS